MCSTNAKCGINKVLGPEPEVLKKLDSLYAKLVASDSKSLLKKYLTKDLYEKLKNKKTGMGSTFLDVIQSGLENLDSGIGIYAPDVESYTLFKELFDPVIEDYHVGFKKTDKQPAKEWGDLNALGNLDPSGDYVISTRVRTGRSVDGYPFNPRMTEAQYRELEKSVSDTMSSLTGELKGTYYPLTALMVSGKLPSKPTLSTSSWNLNPDLLVTAKPGQMSLTVDTQSTCPPIQENDSRGATTPRMDKKVQQQLIDDHFLFKEGDRFLQSANACRFWPTGRGIFLNEKKTFLVWANEEDHLRLISMQMGGDLGEVYRRLATAVDQIEKKVPFSRHDRFGFLTFCLSNLGTAIRASVHIKVPKLSAQRAKLEEVAARYELQVRGTRGEHTDAEGGVYDISNKRRLGITEFQAVKILSDGITEIIKLEKSL
uniref:arginine kinase n=1 Tax=Timema monikensis TaxID=170555 RepID=A0A7R9HJ22_9NEOP|nr:unnamed protein product [Timema monikensis]